MAEFDDASTGDQPPVGEQTDDPTRTWLRVGASYLAVLIAGLFGAITMIRTDNSLVVAGGWLMIVLIAACCVSAVLNIRRR